MTQVQLRYVAALTEAGFTIQRIGREFLIYGYDSAALAPKLDSAVKKLQNKITWHGNPDGIRAIHKVITDYTNGLFL